MIQLHGVGKHMGGQPALHDVSLTLTGSIALLGPNGAGKTTLLRLLASLIRPDTGHLTWHGLDFRMQRRALRERIGYVPQHVDLPDSLTPRRLVHYLAQLRRMTDPSRSNALLSALQLSHAADTPLSGLSGGQVRLVCLAQALLSQPEILLLDEVFTGLGVEERQLVTRLLTVENPARLMVFSTQTLDDAQRLARHAVLLNSGRVTFYGSIDRLHHENSLNF